jgi:HEAT repeat protein
MDCRKWIAPLLVGLLTSGLRAQTTDDLIKEFRGTTKAVERTPDQLGEAYGKVIDQLIAPLNGEAMDDRAVNQRSASQGTLQEIVLRTARPGAEPERAAMEKALLSRLGQPVVYARVWLLRQLQWIGAAPSVPAIVPLLADKEPQISDAARRALVKNPSDEARDALRAALTNAPDAASRTAYINALRQRYDVGAVPLIAQSLNNTDKLVAIAAAEAIGYLGGPDAIGALTQARGAAGVSKPWIDDSLLLAADRVLAAGDADAAATVYRSFLDAQPKRLAAAALQGLAKAKAAEALPKVIAAVKGDDWYRAAAALRTSLVIPGADATKALADLIPSLGPAVAAQLLRTLGERGDASALPQVVAAVQSDDAGVKAAALAAIAKIGDKACVELLAKTAATTNGAVQAAARDSLATLRADGVDVTVIALLKGADGALRDELVRGLSARRSAAAVPALVDAASNDPNDDARVLALDALCNLVDPNQLPALVKVLVNAPSERVRAAAEKAVSAALVATADPAMRAATVLAGYAGTNGPAKLALLRVMGKVGTPTTLDALRAALADADAAVQAAAVLGLSDWPDAKPMVDLLAVVKKGGPEKDAALAGYVRMIALSGGTADARYQQYAAAWGLTDAKGKRGPTGQAILVGLGDVPTLEALKMLVEAADAGFFANDVAASIVKVAGALLRANPEECRTALASAREVVRDNRIRADVDKLLNSLSKGLDAVASWLVSPVYDQAGKDNLGLFDIVFPPEKPDATDVKWTPLTGDPATGALIFDNLPWFGENKVVYLKTQVFAPKAMDVNLEIGSDDGCKVWLNGTLVDAVNANRAMTLGEDKVKGSLKDGWNTLLAKVTQGGGNWSFALQIRDAKGAKIEGLKVKAQ